MIKVISEVNTSILSFDEEAALMRQLTLINETTDLETTFKDEFDKISAYISYKNFLNMKLTNAKQAETPDFTLITQLLCALDMQSSKN